MVAGEGYLCGAVVGLGHDRGSAPAHGPTRRAIEMAGLDEVLRIAETVEGAVSRAAAEPAT